MFDNEPMSPTPPETLPDKIVDEKPPRILRAFIQEEGQQRPKACRKCTTPTICEKFIPKGRGTRKVSMRIWVCPKQAWPRLALAKKRLPRRSQRSIPVTQTGI